MQSKVLKIFVAGGTGFLGSHVVKKLIDADMPFITTSLSQGVDFRDFKQTEKFFRENKFDIIIYCSAFVGGISYGYEKPADIFLNNIQISTNLIELSRIYKIKRFINPISNCSYPGHIVNEFKEENWWDGELHESVLSYGFVRKASWVQSWAYNKQYNMEFVNLLLPNMYGPGDHFEEKRSHALSALIKKFVDAKLKNSPEVVIWGTGTPVREWLYVEDAAEILIRSISSLPSVDPINIGVNKGISIKELAELIKKTVGYKGRLIFDISKPDGAPYKTMNNVKMIKHFMGWFPGTDLKNGIYKTVDWYKKNIDKMIKEKKGENN